MEHPRPPHEKMHHHEPPHVEIMERLERIERILMRLDEKI